MPESLLPIQLAKAADGYGIDEVLLSISYLARNIILSLNKRQATEAITFLIESAHMTKLEYEVKNKVAINLDNFDPDYVRGGN